MSENNKPQRNKPLRTGPNERFMPKVWLIWMVGVMIVISLYMMTNSESNQIKEWKIRDVLLAAQNNEIAEGTIKPVPKGGPDWSEIHGVLKGPEDKKQKFLAIGRLTDENIQLLQQTGVFRELPAGNLFMDLVAPMLPFLVIIAIIYFLFMRQLRVAGRGAMSFGKSKARMLSRDREKITFADVAGCDEAKEDVEEIVQFLKDPKIFQRIGGRIPKGCLLVGPPGTGKTLLARAIAGEADVPFFSISGSDFVEMFVGVGAARVRDMFEQGRKNAPCLVFIDEIDAVGRQRGAGLGGGNDEREQTLNSLLVEMDGFDAHEGVIIIAATNRPDVLDSALLRPGRFDRQIIIDLPDISGREQILKVHSKKIKLAKNVDLRVVARNTSGFSGADLANLLNEGALLAARRRKKHVEQIDIDEARDKIAYGSERRKLMDDDDKKITAYHEAGHALVQMIVDDGLLPVHKVTIIPRGKSLGSTMFMPAKDILNHSRNQVLNQICCAMGGRVAEELVLNEVTSGATGDIRMATKIARHMVCDWGMSDLGCVAYGENQDHIFLGKEITRKQNYSEQTAQHIDAAIREIIDRQYERAKSIVLERRNALETIAEALIQHETIEGQHVREIIEHGEIKTPVHSRGAEGVEAAADEGEESDARAKGKKPKSDEDLGPETSPALA